MEGVCSILLTSRQAQHNTISSMINYCRTSQHTAKTPIAFELFGVINGEGEGGGGGWGERSAACRNTTMIS
jgi:hypothetical protein